ncbi:23S rRNA (guanosine2251-2'-O)-methyltransferase [Mesoplasma entomophilum]|uniref:23S rRNA (Guanosine(2251)-2'-O)-methyltransferase RlmB n=1 Tax=Mesoplasma entomophilum TaxID=2149 RepID=A0A3S5XZM6_9MOLU|nr:23S rRNA (guanosine(2251)-2'-O)-methyltransferase RlmB [Mesoplasma entomophilum]ATQ35251.1 23S rRNA (guanosine(2251)-2'-O)-methyltransferase RlmB [Mesoplasma entomophilum]ATZ19199.1 23S rRNA (guanosine2251-2'-O)-methyltransferase [Mesoplasma entomophilum]
MDNLSLIYGKHAVNEFIKKHPNLIKKVYSSNNFKIEITDYKFQVINTDIKKIEELIGHEVNHQGVIAEVKEFNYKPFNEALNEMNNDEPKLVLILDQIQDPYNFGAIIRSSSLLGVDQIVILDHKQVFVNSTVVKTSAGTVYDMKISKVTNLSNAIKDLQKKGFWIYSTHLNSQSSDMRKVDFANKTAIVIGNEHKGVSELVMKNSDMNVFIPSTNTIDSYNANVAASLILFHVANYIGKLK